MIKILMGGSPCTNWSIAKGAGREVKPEGVGWELFLNYVIAKEKFEPDFFLYENNKSVSPEIKERIGFELGAPLQHIDSALVSAQSRKRFYCHNFGDVPLPEDRGIVLQDILEGGASWTEKGYALMASCAGAVPGDTMQAVCVAQRGRYTGDGGAVQQNFEPRFDGKTNTLTTVGKDNLVGVPVRVGTVEGTEKSLVHDSIEYRVYSPCGKSVTLKGEAGGVGAKTGLYACLVDNGAAEKTVYEVESGQITIKGKQYPIKLPDGLYIIRKLSVTECCRLQTLPDDYCRAVSASQGYKGLGNGWTAEVIIHLLSYALRGVPKDERIVVLSMYDGIGTGRYCLDRLGYGNVEYHAYEIDKYAIAVAMSNYPDIVQHGDAFGVREPGWVPPGK